MPDLPPVQSRGQDGCPTYASPSGAPFSPGALLGAGLNFVGGAGGMLAGGAGGAIAKGLGSLFRHPAHAREAQRYFHVRQVRRERIEARRLRALAEAGDRRAAARLQNFGLGSLAGPLGGAAGDLLQAGAGALRGAGCATMGVGCGSPGQPPGDVMTDVTNTIVAAAVVSAMLDCEGALSVGQTLEVDCGSPDGAEAFPDNAGCAACGAALDAVVAARRKLVLDSGLPAPAGEEDPNSPVFQRLNAVGGEGPCAAACENCVARGVNQSLTVRFHTNCNTASSWRSQIQDNVGTMVSSSVSQVQDALGNLAGVLAAEHECIRKDLTSTIRSRITSDFVTKVRAQVDNWQSLRVAGGSRSVWMAKASEGISITSIIDIVANTQVADNLYSAEEARAAAEFVQQNATVNEFANDVNDVFGGVGELVGTTFGTMLIVMAAVLAAVALGLALLWVVNPQAVRALLTGGAA